MLEVWKKRRRAEWKPSLPLLNASSLPFDPAEDPPDSELRVQLRYATLPRPLSGIAVHGWFVLFDPESGEPERWEIWQERDRGGTSWAHLHRNLMHPDRPVGGGPTVIEREWRGEEARALAAVLRDPLRYPFRERYYAWPGPNSNTYVAWALREAGLEHAQDPRAIGKDYLGTHGFGARRCGAAWQLGCPLAGLKIGPGTFELHLLCFTLGRVDGVLVTPFGRRTRAPGDDLLFSSSSSARGIHG